MEVYMDTTLAVAVFSVVTPSAADGDSHPGDACNNCGDDDPGVVQCPHVRCEHRADEEDNDSYKDACRIELHG